MAPIPSPSDSLVSLQRTLDDFERSSWLDAGLSGAGTYPPINVFRRGEGFMLSAEVPGVKKSDLEIQVKGRTIRLSGTKVARYPEQATLHRRERLSGRFDRTITLPFEIGADRVQAEYRDGVLVVVLPRAPQNRSRMVQDGTQTTDMLGRQHIKALPLRHMVALAMRCVQRIEPIIFHEPQAKLEIITQILTFAHDFVRGHFIDADHVRLAYESLPEWINSGGELPLSPLENQSYTIKSARYVAKALHHALNAASAVPPKMGHRSKVVEHSTAAIYAQMAIYSAQMAADPFRGKRLSATEEELRQSRATDG